MNKLITFVLRISGILLTIRATVALIGMREAQVAMQKSVFLDHARTAPTVGAGLQVYVWVCLCVGLALILRAGRIGQLLTFDTPEDD